VFVYLLGLLDRLQDDAAHETLERLSVPRGPETVMTARQHCRDVLTEFSRDGRIPPAGVRPAQGAEHRTAPAHDGKGGRVQAKRYISLYLTHLREVRIDLTGEDLKKMGLPGPRYKKILTGLLDAKLDASEDA